MFFPETNGQAASILIQAREAGMDITLSGGRTGLTGGCVPQGGWLVSMERMDKFIGLRYDEDNDQYFLKVQAGVRLNQVQEAIVARDFAGSSGWDKDSQAALDRLQNSLDRYFYPPDPTEADSSLGGNAACNASGARTYKYGPTRTYISALKVLLADGAILTMKRGCLITGEQGRIEVPVLTGVREFTVPPVRDLVVKNASGYFQRSGMDLVDLFIGSEGTLGIMVELELRLVRAPVKRAEVLLQLDSEQTAIDLIEILEDTKVTLASIEYLCPRALRFLHEHNKLDGLGIQIPDGLPPPVLLLELEAGEEGLELQLKNLSDQLEKWSIEPLCTMVAAGLSELERFRILRHSLPETINEVIAGVKTGHPEVSKLGMDFSVPRARVQEMVESYHEVLEPLGLEYVLFGHIGSDHLHVNIIPRDQDEYDTGKKAYWHLAQKAVDLGGTVSAEHGIGKLKRDLLLMMYGKEDIDKMLMVKEALDPDRILGQGTLFFLRGGIGECGR